MTDCVACNGVGLDRFGIKCHFCHGEGYIADENLEKCSSCKTKYAWRTRTNQKVRECPKCGQASVFRF